MTADEELVEKVYQVLSGTYLYETYKHRVNIPALSGSAHLPVSANLVYFKILLNNVVKF